MRGWMRRGKVVTAKTKNVRRMGRCLTSKQRKTSDTDKQKGHETRTNLKLTLEIGFRSLYVLVLPSFVFLHDLGQVKRKISQLTVVTVAKNESGNDKIKVRIGSGCRAALRLDHCGQNNKMFK
uniref:Uncharacterized protein n=1 Tax=Schistocephalus solidus TaxID=70667 RepID=A0A0X3NJ85_SCHSO